MLGSIDLFWEILHDINGLVFNAKYGYGMGAELEWIKLPSVMHMIFNDRHHGLVEHYVHTFMCHGQAADMDVS